MQSIVLKNFKSYEHQSLTNLNSRINVIVGANGQGKSNFFKAISFMFTDKYILNKAEYNTTIYRGVNKQTAECSVEIAFNENPNKIDTYNLKRIWRNLAAEDLRINDKAKSKTQFQNFIESFGLSYSNAYNIVQQGKISQIALMKENQLYLLLQEVAGIKKFIKKQEEAKATLSKIDADLAIVDQNLAFLKDKVQKVEDKKNQYQFYSVEQKVRKIKKKREIINYLENINKTLQIMKEKHFTILDDINQKLNRQRQLIWQLQEKQILLKTLNEMEYFYEKENSEEIHHQPSNDKADLKKLILLKQKNLKDIQIKYKKQQKEFKKAEQDMIVLEKQLKDLRQKHQIIKLDFNIQNSSKDQDKMKQAYQLKIVSQEQTIKNLEDEIRKIDKMKSQFKKTNYKTSEIDLEKLKKQRNQQTQTLKSNRIAFIEIGRKKINLQCQIQTLTGKIKNLEDLLRKILPNIDFKLISSLQQLNIKGVYGYLLSHLKIASEVSFAYQLAGISKLCTLLVEDQKVAQKVVEVNKKLKGKNINILPLSFMASQMSQKRSYPKDNKVFSLLNEEWLTYISPSQIKASTKDSIAKIVNNTFSKYALVDDYNTGLKVSKQYSLNCITADREVVYADAFICKVGREKVYDKTKIQIFVARQDLRKTLSSHKNQLNTIQKRQLELQNLQIEIINRKEKIENQIKSLQKLIDQGKKVQQIIFRLQTKKNSLKDSIKRCQSCIKIFQQSIENLKKPVKSKFKQEDLKQAQNEYFNKKNTIDNGTTKLNQKQKLLTTEAKQIEQLEKQILSLKNSIFSNVISKKQMLNKLIKERTTLENQIHQINNSITDILQQKSILKDKELSFLAQITVQQENQREIVAKAEALVDINPQEQDEIQQLSHSLSRKLKFEGLNGNKKMFYTAKDKIFFNKVTNYLQQVQSYLKYTLKLKISKQKLTKYIESVDKDSKKYIKTFIANFQKHFTRYFLRIVPSGKVDIRTKAHAQQIKGITKNLSYLEIKISFNSDDLVRRWSQFSGGQKTILAFCIILAIQKCQPTPFCILDEIDAALDSNYITKIVQIITEQSQNCQYFITSFKKAMLDFPLSIANYYLVKSIDRKSSILPVQKDQIEEFINQLAQ